MAPKKLEKKLRKEEKVKKSITIEKKKEIAQTYESGVRVTDLANMYRMSNDNDNDNVMSYYKTVLKKKQKQTTLDQFLVPKRLRPSDPEAGRSGLQTLPRTERTPDSQRANCCFW